MAKILVVEDDQALSAMIAKWLKDENHVADVANSGGDALQLLGSYAYDMLILDWELPDISGINVCRQYRHNGGKSGVLFLTGRDDVQSKEAGLDSGADDYLTKPFESAELLARVRALLRRIAVEAPVSISIRGVTLELRSRTVSMEGKQIKLGAREFEVLSFLMQHPNCSYSSKALLHHVWPPDTAVAEQTVRSTMYSLRQKLSQGEDGPCIIETIMGEGFIIKTQPDK